MYNYVLDISEYMDYAQVVNAVKTACIPGVFNEQQTLNAVETTVCTLDFFIA